MNGKNIIVNDKKINYKKINKNNFYKNKKPSKIVIKQCLLRLLIIGY